ncbi:NAD(P)H-dependent D-xylose reductase [Magnaporthiopsis poae ATCC 64411]|uniref:NAD(P)H-dependent D-xylose reductase n=1 Tax=Magnaporthiopsis poae (strain ATCC 64411 / 73-15) TaxID=644358 RepID=A0A0C4DMT2_MAGP6|nr:NAD(P)H-dependent D-xylose reductase [Magnaporthiopsis poae ATCC 64411]
MVDMKTVKLNSGYEMPLVGFGIWKVPVENTAQAVYDAIKLGYRHIDGAYDYTNSKQAGEGVQRAIKDGLVKREELFITSKLWNNYHKYEHAIEMAKYEVDTWGVGYLDLFLIHFPISLQYIPQSELMYPCFWPDKERTRSTPLQYTPVSETWAALESLVKTDANPSGILRSIGVANFSSQLVYDLWGHAKIKPAVNQIEHHPYLVQPNLVAMLQEHGIVVTAYSSFGPQSFIELGNPKCQKVEALFTHPTVVKIAEKHKRTPAQVLLRWATQRNIVVIPKSNSVERLSQNLDCVNFDLADEDIKAISALDANVRFNDPADFTPPIRIFD